MECEDGRLRQVRFFWGAHRLLWPLVPKYIVEKCEQCMNILELPYLSGRCHYLDVIQSANFIKMGLWVLPARRRCIQSPKTNRQSAIQSLKSMSGCPEVQH